MILIFIRMTPYHSAVIPA